MKESIKEYKEYADILNRARCVKDINDFSGHPKQEWLESLYKEHEAEEGYFLATYQDGIYSNPCIKFHVGEEEEPTDEEMKKFLGSLPTRQQYVEGHAHLMSEIWE